MAIPIKGIRKWRISWDESNWIIQQKMPKQKPPNDWVNKFFFQDLEKLYFTLLELGVKEENITDFKGMLDAYKKIKTILEDVIQLVHEETGSKIPESQRKKAIKKTTKGKPKTRSKSESTKKQRKKKKS